MGNLNIPLFSIITVCYNSDATIEHTFSSVLHQKIKDYEYIVIDGKSTDGTLDIIKRFEPYFEGRMKWISEPDNGIYNAFNKGIRLSRGKLIWIVNSDDYMEDDALWTIKKTYDEIEEKNWPIISFSANFISSSGAIVRHMFMTEKNSEKAYKKDTQGIVHPATIIPIEIYKKIGVYDERFKIAADLDWFHIAKSNGVLMYFKDETITNMRDGGISSMASFAKLKNDRVLYFKKNYNICLERWGRFLRWCYNDFRIRHGLTYTNLKNKICR